VVGHYKAPKIVTVQSLKAIQPTSYTSMEAGSILHLHLWKQTVPNVVGPLEVSAAESDWKVLGTAQGEVVRVGINDINGHKGQMHMIYGE
jgi:hypothetical protein